ncbi:hypothetical protein ACM32_03775 [Helicobacter pylori]|nr:hypothetical protein ACM32_03775 [Helicobacter pylori]
MLGLSFLKTTAFLKSLDFKLFGFFAVSLRFCYAKIFEIWRLIELNITLRHSNAFYKAYKNFKTTQAEIPNIFSVWDECR